MESDADTQTHPEPHGLVDECISRPHPRKEHRRLPVIPLLGMPGIGKTFTLDAIESRWHRVVPLARLDMDETGVKNLPPRHVIVQIAFQLARKCPQFGRIPFRRLMLCLVVAGAKIKSENRKRALGEIRKAVIVDTITPEHHETT